MVQNRRTRGALGEQIAEAYLVLMGYEVLDRNRWVGRREIDLVARRANQLVAVEVKLRRSDTFGRAVEGAGARKLVGVRRAVELLARELGTPLCPRVDVIAIDISSDNTMTLRHYCGV